MHWCEVSTMLQDPRSMYVLAHASVILFASEQAMENENRRPFRFSMLIVERICKVYSSAGSGGME